MKNVTLLFLCCCCCCCFSRTLKEFMEPFNKSTDAFIKKLKEKADGKTEISMLHHFGRCALDVIAKVKNMNVLFVPFPKANMRDI